MAEILCPICGRSNPDELDRCAHCRASLAGAAPAGATGSGGEDWLSSLRGDDDVYREEEDQADWPGGEEDVPAGSPEADRLERIASGSLAESPSSPDSLPETPPDAVAQQDQPDWLKELLEATSGPADDPETAPGEAVEPRPEEIPDWLNELKPPELSAEAEEPETGPADTPEPLPDWLLALGASEERDDFEPFEMRAVETGSEEPEADPGQVEPEAVEPESDWLAGFIDEPAGEIPVPARPESRESEAPDWLSGFLEEPGEAAPEEERVSGDDFPRWLAGPPEPPHELSHAEPEEDLPPWLGEFEAGADRPETAGRFEEGGWLEDTGPAGALERPKFEGRFDDTGWQDAEADADSDAAGEDEFEPAGDAMPDWLTSALGQVEEGEPDDLVIDPSVFEPSAAGEPVAEGETDADLQEWLSKYDQETEPASEPEREAELDEDVPQWLREVDRVERAGAETTEEGIPDWLRELNELTPAVETAGAPTETAWQAGETDAVDWMPGGTAFGALAEVEGIEEDLAPGDLPEWLRAMRPIEATAPGVMETGESDTGSFERVGPLAGLRGVLSAEPVAAQAGKPPSQSVRLQVSDAQQARANQLQKMVAGETEPQPPGRRPILSEQRVLRYLIAGLLFLTTVLTGLIPSRLGELPAKPPEMDAITPLITGLSPESVVLVVLDYQPGLSGEMDAAASGIVDHVMIQKARLALISTSPTGPALGERLMGRFAADHGYTSGAQYVHLGYLPGAAAGLQLFANAPAAAVPGGYDDRPFWSLVDRAGGSPWAQPALRGISSLNDFGMTLLLSDDSETVRRWVEQVGPFLRPGTLVVISSAQAEPLVRPYLDSGQIAALVSGLRGGAAYEGFLQREGPARRAWDGTNVGTLAVIVLIMGAGTYNLYLAWEERELLRKGGA